MKIYATIGDAELALGRLERARDAFGSAAGSAEAAANPYVHLRYGQVLHALGERGAVDALAKAAIAGGVTVFAIADRLDLLEVVDEKLEPPAGYGSWVEYADSSDWQEIEGTDRIAAEDENDEEGSLVDDFSSDTERVSEDQAAFWQAVDRGDVGQCVSSCRAWR
jgi:hypothetical protein